MRKAWFEARNTSVRHLPLQLQDELRERKAIVSERPWSLQRRWRRISLRAVAVDSSKAGIVGSFWLCDVLGAAQEATQQQAHTTDLFEEGWWIIEIRKVV